MWFLTVFSEMKSSRAMSRLFSPTRHELQYLQLALGEPRRRYLLAALVRALGHQRELGEQLAGHRRADQRLPVVHRANGAGDLVDRDLLQQIAGGARLDRLVEVSLLRH